MLLYDERRPVLSMEESPKQLLAETRTSPLTLSRLAKLDHEYRRNRMQEVLFLAHRRRVTDTTLPMFGVTFRSVPSDQTS